MSVLRLSTPLIALGLAAGLGLASADARATGNTGPYLGASLGQLHGDGRFDDSDRAWKLVGGVNLGWLPFLDLGAEVAYLDGGTLEGEVGGRSASRELESVQAMGVVGWSLGPLGLYAKAGLADWDASDRGTGVSADHSGTDPVYGIGARVQFLGLTGRLEAERIDTDEIGDLDLVSAGVVVTF